MADHHLQNQQNSVLTITWLSLDTFEEIGGFLYLSIIINQISPFSPLIGPIVSDLVFHFTM